MKLAKKLLALSLCAAMVFGVCACDKAENNPADPATQAPVASNAPAETRTIKVGTWFAHYYDSTMQDISVNPNVTDPERDQIMLDNTRAVEEKYNVKIEFVNLTWDGVQESINNSILAGHPDCDIYEADLGFGIPAALAGYATDLATVLPADADLLNDQNIFYQVNCGIKDKVYLFAMQADETKISNTIMLAINKTMMDEAGLEDPNALYERGEWTWDKFREYAQVLTVDKDGDTIPDVYGYGGRHDWTVSNLMMSNGATIASSATETLSSKEVGEALDFIYKLYNEDHVARPWNPDDFNDNQNAYYDAKVAMWPTANWVSASNGNNDSLLDFEQIWCPWPIGPSGNKETNNRTLSSKGNAYFIPTGVKDPAFVYEVFNAWQNWYHDDYAFRDGDMSWWEDSAQNEANYAVEYYIGEKNEFDLFQSLGVAWDWTALMDGRMTAAQFQETWKQSVQSALDVFYGN